MGAWSNFDLIDIAESGARNEWVTCLKGGWDGIGLIVPEIGGPKLPQLKLAREGLEEQQSLEQQLQRL
jgi:hypothetical protein